MRLKPIKLIKGDSNKKLPKFYKYWHTLCQKNCWKHVQNTPQMAFTENYQVKSCISVSCLIDKEPLELLCLQPKWANCFWECVTQGIDIKFCSAQVNIEPWYSLHYENHDSNMWNHVNVKDTNVQHNDFDGYFTLVAWWQLIFAV